VSVAHIAISSFFLVDALNDSSFKDGGIWAVRPEFPWSKDATVAIAQ